jgi:hypothetical protein
MADTRETRWHFLPITGWLPHYEPAWLRFDIVAGVTLAPNAVPQSLAHAGLAGLPPQMGLYCYPLAGLGYVTSHWEWRRRSARRLVGHRGGEETNG